MASTSQLDLSKSAAKKKQISSNNMWHGAVTRWSYENGLPTQMIQETGTEDPDVVTAFKYNRQGQCIKKVTSDGIETHEYGIMGNNLATSLYDLSVKLLSKTLFGYNLNNQVICKQGPNPENTLWLFLCALQSHVVCLLLH